jgi:ParB/RepB/Spo0J family partition protein
MKIEQRNVTKISAYEFNARNHDATQIERIKKSIKEFGFNQPLVVDAEGVIIVGHGRFQAARELGLETVPVVVKKDLTEQQQKAYRILDNKLQNDSTWHWENLALDSLIEWMEKPKQEDQNDLAERLESFENATIKQIVLYFDGISYQRVLKQMQRVQADNLDITDNTEVVQYLLNDYEDRND